MSRPRRIITIYEFDDGTFDVTQIGVRGGLKSVNSRQVIKTDRDGAYDFVNEMLYWTEENESS